MFTPTKAKKARKGFSLVELVIAILIIAVLVAAVFAGGSIIIRNSQISRTTSDLHNFSIAVETLLNENPMVANMDKTTKTSATLGMPVVVAKLNSLLPEDYQLKADQIYTGTGNLSTDGNRKSVPGDMPATGDASDTYVVYESIKEDAWGNPYYVIFDYADRNATGVSDFFVTVVSAGPNAKSVVTGQVDDKQNNDDIFLLGQYTDGSVSSLIYNQADTVENTLMHVENGNTGYTNGANTETPKNYVGQDGPRVFAKTAAA